MFICSFVEKASVVKYISNLKSLKNLRIQAVDEMHDLTIMIFCSNKLPELKSYECRNSEHITSVLFCWPTQTNIEDLTVECVLHGLGNILLQTPKLKYLNIVLTGLLETIEYDQPFPIMMNLIYLKIKIYLLSYNHLSNILKAMPKLESIELSGQSFGENFDNGHKLKQLFGHLKIVDLDNLVCLPSVSSVKKILKTFNNDNDGFWSDVTCSIEYKRAYLSAFGHAKYKS
jgi:hypothetical protein